jgi:hypothetical protein
MSELEILAFGLLTWMWGFLLGVISMHRVWKWCEGYCERKTRGASGEEQADDAR